MNPCQLSTPPRLWHCQFLPAGAQGIYEYWANVVSQRVPQQFFGPLHSAVLKQKIWCHATTWCTDWTPPSPKYISLQLPYLDSISNNIRQELSSFIRHKAVVKVKLRCFHSTQKLQSWFSIKDRQVLLNRFNVVYKLTCSCGASYIGQTQRNLINRIEEHRTSLSSSVCRHLQANPDHRVVFHNPEVIGSDNRRRLQILESLLIQEHKPELNANIPSMPLCIFNL